MMTFQRFAIVVGLLFCYSFTSLEAAINCERLVFHPDCRGSQTKRSSLQTDEGANYISPEALEELFGMPEKSRKPSHSPRSRTNINNNYEKSRFWTVLQDRGLNPEIMYDWYLAQLEEKNADSKRQNWMRENFPGKNIADGDY